MSHRIGTCLLGQTSDPEDGLDVHLDVVSSEFGLEKIVFKECAVL
jgi:hypothetical protein